MVTISVTDDQVRAARTQVNALRSAGLTPDPLVVQLAEAQPADAAEIGPSAATL